jgi:GNAT superfamily N-acetyltransferase
VEEAAREAADQDLPRLGELAEAALAELRAMRGGEMWAAQRAALSPQARVEAALHDDAQLVLVGTIDGATVGYSVARIDDLPDGRRIGVLDDIFVEEGARGIGVGEVLMEAALQWCRDRGCVAADATALPGHRATKNFFEESGFTARLLVMHRQL